MAEPSGDLSKRIAERVKVARRELAEIDPEGGIEPLLNAHLTAILALIDCVDALTTEVDRLRSHDAPS
jgi:hypothetical protein